MAFLYEFSKDGNQRAREVFERAVVLDPTYARGYAGIAYSHHRDVFLACVDDPAPSIAACLEAAQRAVSLDHADALAHFVLSRGLHLAGRIEQALHAARLSIQLNPNDTLGHASLGGLLIASGQPDEGVAEQKRALQLSPKDPRAYLFLTMQGSGCFVSGRYDEAARLAQDALTRRPGYQEAEIFLVASLGLGGQAAAARDALSRSAPIDARRLDLLWATQWLAPTDRERLRDGLRMAGWVG
jgi:adenylate cyclase